MNSTRRVGAGARSALWVQRLPAGTSPLRPRCPSCPSAFCLPPRFAVARLAEGRWWVAPHTARARPPSCCSAREAMLRAVLRLRESARGAGRDQGGLEWSLLPARLIETIWPAAFGSQRVDGWLAGLALRDGPGDPCWSYSLFLGLPVLLCAWAAARQRVVRRLLLASAVFLVLAVGPLLPVFAVLREVFPPLRWVNFPEKFVYGALLLWSAAAGAGFSRLAAEGASRRLRLAACAGTALLALGVASLALSRTAAAATLPRRAAALGGL